jgi:hypothetical protein
MRAFTYEGAARLGVILTQVGGTVSIVFWTLVAGSALLLSLQVDPPYWGASCFVIWILGFGWAIGLTLVNVYPTVWIEDQGLVISAFLFQRVMIPWTEIVDVGAGHVPFGSILVRARRITPFHRVYGWLYSRTLLPSFLIGRDIQDRDELLREIKKRIQATRLC